MAKKSSNRSVYLPDEDWVWLEARAEVEGVTLNGMVRHLVGQARWGVGASLSETPPAASGRAKPRSPEKKSPTPAASHSLPTGRAKAAPGSRLKIKR